MESLKVKITFLEEVLGTSPNNEEIFREYIASKSPDAMTIEEEVAALGIDETTEQGMTVFPRNKDGQPFLYDYQIKGFFKDTCGALARVKTTESSKIRAYKKIIDGLIFPAPREITLNVNGTIGSCQRPLRASTPQGERVALANSETVPAGTTCEFEIMTFDSSYEDQIKEWLDYGVFRGIGQWRNSGKGRFKWEEIS